MLSDTHTRIHSHTHTNKHACPETVKVFATYIYKYMRNIIKHNDELQWTNEHTSLSKYISHTLFSKGLMWVVCERWAGDGDRLLYWPCSTFFSSSLGCSTVVHREPKALCLPLALNSASCLQLTVFQKMPKFSAHDVIHTPVPFPIWGLLGQLWLSYPLRTSVDCSQCLCTSTKSRIV